MGASAYALLSRIALASKRQPQPCGFASAYAWLSSFSRLKNQTFKLSAYVWLSSFSRFSLCRHMHGCRVSRLSQMLLMSVVVYYYLSVDMSMIAFFKCSSHLWLYRHVNGCGESPRHQDASLDRRAFHGRSTLAWNYL